MKPQFWLAIAALGLSVLAGCADEPVQRVESPNPQDSRNYTPQVQPKPMSPEAMPSETVPGQGMQGQPGMNAAQAASAGNALPEEEGFVRAYQTRRSPRIMVFVNRTIHGDVLPKADLEELIRVEDRQAADVTRSDYEMIELSLMDYLDCGGRVIVKDSELVRGKLNRDSVLRIENSDPAAIRLLNTELQTDVLVQVKATPTRQSQWPGGAIRLLAKVMSTTDGRILSSSFVDMPLPMSKPNVNIFTRYLAEKMMQKLSAVWSGNPEWDPIEMRIYKAAGVDDTITIRRFLQKLPGVQRVNTQNATGSTSTAYATLSIVYSGAPEDLYADLKESLKASSGLKSVDLSGNTIDVEVTGPMNLVSTTRTTETKTTVETNTTEVKTVEPIHPAPAGGQ